jgi:hypothetical protein
MAQRHSGRHCDITGLCFLFSVSMVNGGVLVGLGWETGRDYCLYSFLNKKKR